VQVQADTARQAAVIDSVHNEMVRVFADGRQVRGAFESGHRHFSVTPLAQGDDPVDTDSIIAIAYSEMRDRASAQLYEGPLAVSGALDSLEQSLPLEDCDPPLDSLLKGAERILAGARDTATMRDAHYVIAAAVSDQLLATSTPTLRAMAIKHLRGGLLLERGTGSSFATRAAMQLWRLLAGMRPGGQQFGECGD
jgi:hypothetical protein